MSREALKPGATIGILGGGQLGRMLALAAAQLGFKCHIFAPKGDNPACDVAACTTIAEYDDQNALRTFANQVDVITFEFENVPVSTAQFLETLRPVRPGSKALGVAQDRVLEKQLARAIGATTAEFAPVASLEQLKTMAPVIGFPGLLKTRRLGYDGKGQVKIASQAELESAWAIMQDQAAIYEGFVNFRCEVSVLVARGVDGTTACYDITENIHRNQMLDTSRVPARIAPDLASRVQDVAQTLATELDYVGLLGVEFFVGEGVFFVNEIAPRVHNSGHWTQNACVVSQFEQHIRAIAGWTLGDPRRHSNCVMTNLIGNDVLAWRNLASEPQCAVHIYGKAEARPGRKMGHVNRLSKRSA